MRVYFVYSISEMGIKTFDFIKAEDITKIFETLEKSNEIAIKVIELPEQLSFVASAFEPTLKQEEVIEILDNLAIGLKHGVRLNEAIQDVIEDTTNPNVKKILLKIDAQINAGETLSSAFSEYEKYFSQIVINLVKIGEETGELDEVLENSANFLKKIALLKQKIKKAMIYPSVAVGLMLVVIGAWMLLVVPQLVGFFKDMDMELPPLTQFLIVSSDFINEYIFHIIGVAISFIILIRLLYTQSKLFKLLMSKLFLRIPVASIMIKSFNIAFISEYLKVGISSGLTLYEALILVNQSLSNPIYKAEMIKSVDGLKSGLSFSETLKDAHLFTKFTVRMVKMGETNGVLERQLAILSDSYYKQVDDLSNTIPKVIQPMVTLVAGGLMAVIMIGLMGPIYDLISEM